MQDRWCCRVSLCGFLYSAGMCPAGYRLAKLSRLGRHALSWMIGSPA